MHVCVCGAASERASESIDGVRMTFVPTAQLMLALNVTLQAAQAADRINCSSKDTDVSVLAVSQDVMFSGLSVIIPSGLVLNALSLVVFMSKAMRRRASSWYLAALAASDTLSLIAVSFDYWLKDNRIGLQVPGTHMLRLYRVTPKKYATTELSLIRIAKTCQFGLMF